MRIVSFNLKQNPEYVAPLIACYQEVFRAPPWNEEWWTETLVRAELSKYDHAHAASFLAIDRERVVGFHWGGVYETSQLECELGLTLLGMQGQVLYLKDIGVRAEYRKRGVATRLFAPVLRQLAGLARFPRYVAARTMGPPEPSVVFDWFQRDFGFSVGATYCAPDGRVILTQEYDRLIKRI